MISDLIADLEASLRPNPARPRWAWWAMVALKTITLPRVRVLWCYRLGHALQHHGLRPAAWLLVRHAQKVAGAEIDPGATIGPGLDLWHTCGIVIGPDARIGAHATLCQGVTIGIGPKPGMATIGDHVMLGAGALILGGVHIGDHARIGAGAIVVTDVPSGVTVTSPAATAHRRPDRSTV